MKFKYSIQYALLIIFSLLGCQDLEEDPKSILTTSNYLSNETEMEGALSSMYAAIAPWNGWGFTFASTSYFGSDDITTDPGLNKGPFRDFDRFAGTSDNGFAITQWQGPWRSIYQANFILDNIDNIDASQAYKDGAKGQALFMRGLCYYYLVRTFGKLPIVTTAIIELGSQPARAPVKEVYDLIISDLEAAELLLPPSWDNQPGKSVELAAASLLSDVYLTMTGHPLNDSTKYVLSAAKAKKVIDRNEYTLVPDFAEVFTTNGNSEAIFSLWYNVGGGLADLRYGSSATPIEEVALDGSSGWQDFCAELAFFEKAPVCKRTEDTFYTKIKLRNPDKVTYNIVNWDSDSTRIKHPYYKKFRAGLNGDATNESDTQIFSIGQNSNKTFDIIRYPQVLLNYAEASAMSGSPTAESYAAIEEVRRRAGLLTPLPISLSQIEFRDEVVYERAYEFAAEFGVRWFDIVRLQLIPEILLDRDAREIPVSNEVNVDPTNFYLAPIPRNEMARNPEWDQNPGYGG
jgi:hypothetical protein